MGANTYVPFAVEQKNQQKEAAADKNPFADPGWDQPHSAAQNSSTWQDVHLDPSHPGNPGASQAASAAKGAGDKTPAWAFAAAEPKWDPPAHPAQPALGSTTTPPQPAPAFYGSGPPEFSGQTIYNVNEDVAREKCTCNLDWWLFGIGFFTGITWFIGSFTPYCRNPRHPTRSHQMAHRANVVMAIILVVAIIIAIGVASTHSGSYYYNCCGYNWGFCQPC